MSLGYSVNVDRVKVKEVIDYFESVGGNTNTAVRIAANKSAAKMRTLASKMIREQLRLKASYVGDQLKLRKASRQDLSAAISSRKFGILLSRYSADPSIAAEGMAWDTAPRVPISGIRVKVKPGGPSIVFKGDNETKGLPFYLVLRGSFAIGIAARRKVRTKLGSRIKVFHGPSVSQAFDNIRDDIKDRAADEFQFQLLDAMRFILVKRQPQE